MNFFVYMLAVGLLLCVKFVIMNNVKMFCHVRIGRTALIVYNLEPC